MIALAPGDIVRFKGKHFLYTGYDGVQNNMVMPVVYGLDGERTCTMLVLHVAEAHRDALVGDYRATLLLAGNRIGWTWDGYVERDPMICPGDLITPVRDWIHLCKSVSPDGWLLNAMSPVWPSGSDT